MTGLPAVIEPMTLEDLPEVLAIERASFNNPWTEANFAHELTSNPWAVNVVAKHESRVVGFLCAYVVADEVMINDLAVQPGSRRHGLAREVLRHVLEAARLRGCRRATLEVRPSNAAALALYTSFQFEVVGRRPGYYTDTKEDGLLLARDL